MSSIRSSSSSTTWPDFSTLQQSLDKTADTDGDGSISKDEFTTLLSSNSRLASDLAKLTSTTGSESGSTAASIFAALDTSGSGALSEAQFKTALSDARQAGQSDAGAPPPPPPDGSTPGNSDSASTSPTSLSASLYSSEQVQQILMAALAKLQQAGGYKPDSSTSGVTATLKATA